MVPRRPVTTYSASSRRYEWKYRVSGLSSPILVYGPVDWVKNGKSRWYAQASCSADLMFPAR